MILHALTRHYEDLLSLGRIPRPGWGTAKVSYALDLSLEGEILALLPLKTEQLRGKKAELLPRKMEVPMPVGRSGTKPKANFLCDHSGYFLGVDGKGNPKRAGECFAACKALHLELLEGLPSPAAQAITGFFRRWDPQTASQHPALAENWKDLMAGDNLVFWVEGQEALRDPEIRAAWQSYYNRGGDGPTMCCLVTGETGPVELTHPFIKGVWRAQPSGAALVSFNAPAFCSYDREQNANAPVGAYAAFAYTTALNHLLADREYTQTVGDTTVVFWAEGGEPAYQEVGMAALYGDSDAITQQDLSRILRAVSAGESIQWQGAELDPQTRFYVLGLSPNEGRLSVRFFYQNSFGGMLRHIEEHYERLEIQRPAFDQTERLPLWKLLAETVNQKSREKTASPLPPCLTPSSQVNQKSREKTASPQMAGDLLRAILSGSRYPSTLLTLTALRIRAEREVTRGRAAILKAYYLRNQTPACPKEVLTVELNENSSYLPYVLGRLFSVLEGLQNAANPGINSTIKDKYFNSAAATPATIFPLLLNLSEKHLRKLGTAQKVYYSKQIGGLVKRIQETYPARMTLPEQGAFQLGYYHQTQKRYTKKEEIENV